VSVGPNPLSPVNRESPFPFWGKLEKVGDDRGSYTGDTLD
jgi:hypothetical protein